MEWRFSASPFNQEATSQLRFLNQVFNLFSFRGITQNSFELLKMRSWLNLRKVCSCYFCLISMILSNVLF